MLNIKNNLFVFLATLNVLIIKHYLGISFIDGYKCLVFLFFILLGRTKCMDIQSGMFSKAQSKGSQAM